jgi:hypothetical protein
MTYNTTYLYMTYKADFSGSLQSLSIILYHINFFLSLLTTVVAVAICTSL